MTEEVKQGQNEEVKNDLVLMPSEHLLIKIWQLHGGWDDIKTSPYVKWSLALSIFFCLCALLPRIHHGYPLIDERIINSIICILPCLLGFSIASLALFHTFGSSGFQDFIIKNKLPKKDNKYEPSYYLEFICDFSWFILIQILALALAFIAMALDGNAPQANDLQISCYAKISTIVAVIAIIICTYAIALIIAIIGKLFSLSELYEAWVINVKDNPDFQLSNEEDK